MFEHEDNGKAYAERIANRLPKTGQTTSYATGDDGAVQAGKDHRFQVVGNLVMDHATRLCWVKNPAMIIPGGDGKVVSLNVGETSGIWASGNAYFANDLVQYSVDSKYYICIADHTASAEILPTNTAYWVETPWAIISGGAIVPATMTWADAVANSLMTYAGFGPWSPMNRYGWRLPNTIELMTLKNAKYSMPVDATFNYIFDILPDDYWSSTHPSNYALYTSFLGIATQWSVSTANLISGKYVLPVRSF